MLTSRPATAYHRIGILEPCYGHSPAQPKARLHQQPLLRSEAACMLLCPAPPHRCRINTCVGCPPNPLATKISRRIRIEASASHFIDVGGCPRPGISKSASHQCPQVAIICVSIPSRHSLACWPHLVDYSIVPLQFEVAVGHPGCSDCHAAQQASICLILAETCDVLAKHA